ncbi:MAG: hypothetical protein GIW95_09550 [Candidatus Eremiobacteraeota bacterium]|nr:hypothetical protein [Candidatus Eremiobacteraeota bacterium]
MTKRRWWTLGGALVLVWIVVEVYRAGLNEKGPPPAAPPAQFKAGAGLGERLKGRSWTVKYDKITSNPEQTLIDLEGVHDGVIYKSDKPYLKVRATRMTVNMVTKDFAASGTLHIETFSKDPHRSFDTTSATWNNASQRLVLPNRSTIDTGAEVPLLVDSATLDVKTGDVQLNKVTGAVKLK